MATVQVRVKGQFTIPVKIREKLKIKDNEVMTIEMLSDQAFIVFPHKLRSQKILEETAQLAQKRGVTLEEMLRELDEIRHSS